MKRVPPALKHGAYSEAALLPGEDPADYEELHGGLIAEFAPRGRMEEETVATIARLMWRRQNLAHFEIAQLTHVIAQGLEKATAAAQRDRDASKQRDVNTSKEDDELISHVEKLIEANRAMHKAPEGSRKDEAAIRLFEVSKEVILSRLEKELDLEERLDSMIDRLIKRLLFVRGLKSMTSSPATAPPSTGTKALRSV